MSAEDWACGAGNAGIDEDGGERREGRHRGDALPFPAHQGGLGGEGHGHIAAKAGREGSGMGGVDAPKFRQQAEGRCRIRRAAADASGNGEPFLQRQPGALARAGSRLKRAGGFEDEIVLNASGGIGARACYLERERVSRFGLEMVCGALIGEDDEGVEVMPAIGLWRANMQVKVYLRWCPAGKACFRDTHGGPPSGRFRRAGRGRSGRRHRFGRVWPEL